MREKLRNSTVITIAHRLNNIADCDTILVYREGKLADALLKSEGSELSRPARASEIEY